MEGEEILAESKGKQTGSGISMKGGRGKVKGESVNWKPEELKSSNKTTNGSWYGGSTVTDAWNQAASLAKDETANKIDSKRGSKSSLADVTKRAGNTMGLINKADKAAQALKQIKSKKSLSPAEGLLNARIGYQSTTTTTNIAEETTNSLELKEKLEIETEDKKADLGTSSVKAPTLETNSNIKTRASQTTTEVSTTGCSVEVGGGTSGVNIGGSYSTDDRRMVQDNKSTVVEVNNLKSSNTFEMKGVDGGIENVEGGGEVSNSDRKTYYQVDSYSGNGSIGTSFTPLGTVPSVSVGGSFAKGDAEEYEKPDYKGVGTVNHGVNRNNIVEGGAQLNSSLFTQPFDLGTLVQGIDSLSFSYGGQGIEINVAALRGFCEILQLEDSKAKAIKEALKKEEERIKKEIAQTLKEK